MPESPLLVTGGLVKRFGTGARLVSAVDDVSFSIGEGETFGLVGESGSGKSTVARLVLRLERADAGRVSFEGRDVYALDRDELRQLRGRMQMVFQDPHSSLNRRHTVREIVRAPLDAHGVLDRRSREDRVATLLGHVGLGPEHAHRHPHELSGGQAQRVSIARAIALDPRLLVLDEPVSALDVSIRAQILNLLRDLQQRLRLTYLFISHDLAVVRYMAQTVAVMYRGRIVETAPRDALFAHPRHPYTRALMQAVPQVDVPPPAAAPPVSGGGEELVESGCRFASRCPFARDTCRLEAPPLARAAGDHLVACHFPLAAPGDGDPLPRRSRQVEA